MTASDVYAACGFMCLHELSCAMFTWCDVGVGVRWVECESTPREPAVSGDQQSQLRAARGLLLVA